MKSLIKYIAIKLVKYTICILFSLTVGLVLLVISSKIITHPLLAYIIGIPIASLIIVAFFVSYIILSSVEERIFGYDY